MSARRRSAEPPLRRAGRAVAAPPQEHNPCRRCRRGWVDRNGTATARRGADRLRQFDQRENGWTKVLPPRRLTDLRADPGVARLETSPRPVEQATAADR